ncbi:hypothetical protein WDU94_008319 [Cyamophila willieti]
MFNSMFHQCLLLLIYHVTSSLTIIQGTPCQSSESFNHIVLIFNKYRLKTCTGTLITSSWVLTSASCFTTPGKDRVHSNELQVQAGTLLDMLSEQITRRKRFIDFIDAREYEKINSKTYENIGPSEKKIQPSSFIRRKHLELEYSIPWGGFHI